jgi:hypothetical protein
MPAIVVREVYSGREGTVDRIYVVSGFGRTSVRSVRL